MPATHYLILCRHAAHDDKDHLTNKGVRQSKRLGRRIQTKLELYLRLKCSCLITSGATRAIETGNVVSGYFPCVPLVTDNRWGGGRFFPDPLLMLQVQCAVRNAWVHGECVIVVTHSEVIDAVERLFQIKPYHASFRAACLGSDMLLVFPKSEEVSRDNPGWGGWVEENQTDFVRKSLWVERMAGEVGRMWKDRVSTKWGESRIVDATADWVIREDVWAMDKWGMGAKDRKPLIAMIKACMERKGPITTPLRCLRDLTRKHLGALKELDEMYEDTEWLKFISFPPYVWHLHVHIQQWEYPIPLKNVYLLKDVIDELEEHGSFADRPLLVWMYPESK